MITRSAKCEIDLHLFLADIKKCSGKIYLETPKGDSFNIQSVFSRYVLAVIIRNGKLPEGSVYTFEERDLPLLKPYLA